MKRKNGGQSGNALPFVKQSLKSPNSKKSTAENTEVSDALPTPVELAAGWLARNRDAVSGPLLPFLRRRFDLTSLQAIEAAKRAHQIEYGG